MDEISSPSKSPRVSARRLPSLNAMGRAYTRFAQLLVALVAVAVLAAAAFPEPRDVLLRQASTALKVAEPVRVSVNVAAGPIQSAQPTEAVREQRAVTEMLAKRYRVAQGAVGGFVEAAYRIGRQTAVDPLLILAVISVESRFNPVAQSDFGAKGLMQVIAKFHMEKLAEHGGEEALLDPEVNIRVGALVLREYMRRFGGTETALQAYAGAFDEPTAQYANKVLSERSRIEQTVARLRRAV